MADYVANLDGFKEAQERLVSNLGVNVTFSFAPQAYVYPSGTYVDPQTGVAIDPRIDPVMVITPSAMVVKATKIRNVPTMANEGDLVKGGIIPAGKMWLRIPEGTYPSAILAAKHVVVHSETFLIERFINDGIGDNADRLYVEAQYDSGGLSSPAPSGVAPTSGTIIREQFTASAGQMTFSLAVALESGSSQVFLDGIAQSLTSDYVELVQGIQFNDPCTLGQKVLVWYRAA